MKIIEKKPEKDFILLNLSDPQLGDLDYGEDNLANKVLIRTITELIDAEHPDLITVSGDLAYGEQYRAYREFASMMESFGIPWAPVWGNHDDQCLSFPCEIAGKILRHHSPRFCLYEEGAHPEDGRGNYFIGITENGKPVTAVFLQDSHDRDVCNGKDCWGKLSPTQVERLEKDSLRFRKQGYKDGLLVLHIPIYAYREAFEAAFSGICKPEEVKPGESGAPKYWNDGYKDSFGVIHEGIASYPAEEGAFAAIQRGGLIKAVIAGHDHVNNTSINWKGIRLVYSLKAGTGCYWDKELNGGTVIRIGSDGIREIVHRYVDVRGLLEEASQE